MGKNSQQKRKARERNIRRETNIRRNNVAHKAYTLTVEVDGEWRPVMQFSTKDEVKKYVESVEDLRKRGDTEIIRGRITHRVTGRIMAEIESFNPDTGKTDILAISVGKPGLGGDVVGD